MTLGDVIKQYRSERGYSMEDFSRLSGISKGYISMLEKNKNPNTGKPIVPTIDMFRKVAVALDIQLDTLIAMVDKNQLVSLTTETKAQVDLDIPPGFIPLPKMRKIPLVGNIACGVPILAEENIEGEVDLPDDINADYALRCKGDSMIGCGIRDGDVVYIRKTGEVPRNGQIVAVRIEDEATLKRFYLDGSEMRLVAENPSVPTLYYSGPQLELVSVEGIAVGYTHKIRE